MSDGVAEVVRWFETERPALAEMGPREAADAIGEAVHRLVSTGLGIEVADEAGVREVVITAGGDEGLFGLVRSVCSALRPSDGWRFEALKPPQGFAFVLDVGASEVDAESLRFVVLGARALPGQVGVRVFSVDRVPPIPRDVLRLILETGLGEEVFAVIHHIEFSNGAVASNALNGVELAAALERIMRDRLE